MELLDHIHLTLESINWLPGVISLSVAFPSYPVLDSSAKASAVQYSLDLIEELILLIIHLHLVITFSSFKGFQHSGMNNVMKPNALRELEFVRMTADDFDHLVGTDPFLSERPVIPCLDCEVPPIHKYLIPNLKLAGFF